MFRAIDDWLFEKIFQPFADWFCDNTDRSPLWLAATCIYIWIAAIVYDNVEFPNSLLSMTLDAFLVIFFGYTALSYDRKSIAPDKTSLTLNPNRQNQLLRLIRVVCILLLPSDIWAIFTAHPGQGVTHSDAVNLLQSVTLMLFLYFEACETKPPAPPKRASETKLSHVT
jgi:hypothetical protein